MILKIKSSTTNSLTYDLGLIITVLRGSSVVYTVNFLILLLQIDFSRQNLTSDEILTSKVDPRTVRVKICILAVDP